MEQASTWNEWSLIFFGRLHLIPHLTRTSAQSKLWACSRLGSMCLSWCSRTTPRKMSTWPMTMDPPLKEKLAPTQPLSAKYLYNLHCRVRCLLYLQTGPNILHYPYYLQCIYKAICISLKAAVGFESYQERADFETKQVSPPSLLPPSLRFPSIMKCCIPCTRDYQAIFILWSRKSCPDCSNAWSKI